MPTIQQLANNIQVKKHSTITFSGAIFGLSIAYFIVTGDAAEADSMASFGTLQIILSMVIGIASAYSVYFTGVQLDKLLPWHKQEGNRLLVGIITHFISVFFVSVLMLYLGSFLWRDLLDFTAIQEQYLLKLGIILLILVLIIEIIYFALYSYYSYTSFQIETVRQERKQIELQFKALKSQLSPHFLFNSLNTISSLVFKDKTKAEGFIRKLAEMYQYTLQSYQTQLVSVQEELDFVNSYQYLLQTRFGAKFQCSIEVDEELLATNIPPLTLQMLLENAVKHNVLSEEDPLKVQVTSDKKYIIVQNNITKKPQKVSSFQIGLKNINARYLLLHDEGIQVSNGANFVVKVPIIS
jgi:sensor histidine kinase YesM